MDTATKTADITNGAKSVTDKENRSTSAEVTIPTNIITTSMGEETTITSGTTVEDPNGEGTTGTATGITVTTTPPLNQMMKKPFQIGNTEQTICRKNS